MTNAFEISGLVEKLKAKGLPLAEEAVQLVEESVIEWIQESVLLTPTLVDDLAIPVLAALKPMIDAQIAKIAGE